MNNIKSSPRDVFMHLLVIITLYISAGSFMTLVFQYINIGFPDPLNPYFDPGTSIRWALASLIVIFPVFLWGSKFLHRDIKKNPERAEMKIRKWLLYFTVFVAAGFIIGDLIALIFGFLEGEITARFVLKVLTILIVAIAVFGYYLQDLKEKPKGFYRSKSFVWGIIVIVSASIIFGFFVAGSPILQRQLKFDRQRVNDLQIIQNQIVNFWQQKEELPKSLEDLTDNISGFKSPKDPDTKKDYIYKVTGDLTFELCAEFNLELKETTGRERFVMREEFPIKLGSENWTHSAGLYCFDREIDPDIYKRKVENF